MAVETLKIVPELDPAAAKKFQSQMDRLTDPVGRAMKQATGAVSSFRGQVKQVENVLLASRKTSKDFQRDIGKTEKIAEKMRIELAKAERSLGKGSHEVLRMKREYTQTLRAADLLAKAAERTAAAEAKAARSAALRSRVSGAISAAPGRIGGAITKGALVGAGVATGATLGAFAAVNRARADADKAAKSANLTSVEFGRLARAASLSGSSIEVADKAVAKLNSNLSKKQTPEIQAALKTIGLTAEQLQDMRPEQQLGAIGDALKDVRDPAARVTIASRLLGEEAGPRLTALLEAGTAGIKAMGDEAEKLGLVFDQDTAAAAERFGDAQDKIRWSIEGLVNQIAGRYMPALADASEGVVAWILDNRDQIEAWVAGVIDKLVSAGQAAAEWAASVDWGAVWERISAVGEIMAQVAGIALDFASGMDTGSVAMGVLAVKVGASLGPLGLLATAAVGLGYKIGESMVEAKNAILAVNMDLKQLAGRIREIQELAELQTKRNQQLEEDAAEEEAANNRKEKAERAKRIGARATRAAEIIYGKGRVPRKVTRQIAAMVATAGDPNASTEALRGVRAQLDALEEQAGKKQRGGLSGGGGKAPKEPKEEVSAAGGAVEADIKKYAQAAGTAAYQQAISQGATLAQANEAAVAAEKAKAEELRNRPDLVRAGLLGQGTNALTGVPLTAGGALPIALDLGSKGGGPPPVQIIQVAQGAEINLEFPQARFDADLSTLSDTVAPAVRSEMERMWASVIPAISGGVQTR